MTILRERMAPLHFFGRPCHIPAINVSFHVNGKWSAHFRGIVDSGAICTLASIDIAQTIGLDMAAIRSGNTQLFSGLGGTNNVAYEYIINIKLTNSVGAHVKRCIECDHAKIFFTTGKLPYPILLGQHDALERLCYVQRNSGAKPEFVLHDYMLDGNSKLN